MINYIILGVIFLLAGWVVYRAIRNKQAGLNSCSGCSGCGAKDICPSKQDGDSSLPH